MMNKGDQKQLNKIKNNNKIKISFILFYFQYCTHYSVYVYTLNSQMYMSGISTGDVHKAHSTHAQIRGVNTTHILYSRE